MSTIRPYVFHCSILFLNIHSFSKVAKKPSAWDYIIFHIFRKIWKMSLEKRGTLCYDYYVVLCDFGKLA